VGNHARLIPVTIIFNLFQPECTLPCKLGCKSFGLVPTEISCHYWRILEVGVLDSSFTVLRCSVETYKISLIIVFCLLQSEAEINEAT